MSVNNLSLPSSELLTLGQYIVALITALGDAHPAALARMRHVVGDRRARIVLDDEAVEVAFDPEGLRVEPATGESSVDGEGTTSSAVILALLDGYLEVTDAILTDQLRISGRIENIPYMFTAIEILLDASSRTPSLQALADRFRAERRVSLRKPTPARSSQPWYPFACETSEFDLLTRLDLLPDASSSNQS